MFIKHNVVELQVPMRGLVEVEELDRIDVLLCEGKSMRGCTAA